MDIQMLIDVSGKSMSCLTYKMKFSSVFKHLIICDVEILQRGDQKGKL